MWWQALGYTPAGVECWNGIRGIDYLVSRPEVDAERIGVTGISGGGAATFWIAAADERVKVAVPVSGMSDLESYVTNKVINGHCDCMFLVNTYQWDWTTIAALIAPRPLLFANSDKDTIFPMDGNRRVIAKLRQVYKMYDKPDLVDEYVSKGGHDYRPDLRMAVFKWINKHLKNDTAPVKDADFKLLPGKELRVFPEEKDVPKDAINGKIDETFVKRAEVKLPEKGKFAEWKKGMSEGAAGEVVSRHCHRAIPTAQPRRRGASISNGTDIQRGSGRHGARNRGRSGPCPCKGRNSVSIRHRGRRSSCGRFGGRGPQELLVYVPRAGSMTGPRNRPRTMSSGRTPCWVERSMTGRVRDIAATAKYLARKREGGRCR